MTEEIGKERRDWTGVVIALVVAPVYIIFLYLGKEDIGRTAGLVLGMLVLAVRIRWKSRKHVWFWATVIVLFSLHLPLILKFRWPHRWISGTELLPFGVVDLLITLGCIWVVEKLTALVGSMKVHRRLQ